MTDMTCDESGGSQVLKTDTKGRVRSTAAQREVVLEQFKRSGLSGTKFAQLAGVNYQTFAGWRRQQQRKQAKSARASLPAPETLPSVALQQSRAVQWIEAEAAAEGGVRSARPAGASSSLRLRLPGGMEMELTEAGQMPLVAALLKAVQEFGRFSC